MKQLTDNIKAILVLLTLLLTFIYFFAVTFLENKADPQIIIAIIGINALSYGYYFNSSSSGAKKDELISNMAQNITPTELTLPEAPIKVDVTKDKK